MRLPPNDFLFRRIHPKDITNGRLNPGFYELRPGHSGVSVFEGCYPNHHVLQCLLDDINGYLSSGEEKIIRKGENLATYGNSVEKLLLNGWRVGRIRKSSFLDRKVFQLTTPNYRGHLNVVGKKEDFMLHSDDLTTETFVLDPMDCFP